MISLRFRSILLCIAAALAACSSAESRTARASESSSADRPLALVDVTVIDGTGAPPRPHMTVVVEGGRIAAIFPVGQGEVPRGAEVPDVAGHYVIPGLIDSHAHLATFDRGEIYPVLLRGILMGGVTTVRDMGGNTAVVARLAREARAADAMTPRIYFSGVVAGPYWFANYDSTRLRYWSGGHPIGRAPGVRALSSDAEIEGIVDEARAMGATGIKVYTDVPPERLAALARAAHARGLRVWTHAIVPPSRPEQVAAAGADVVSHADMLIWSAAGAGDSIGPRAGRSRLLATVTPESPPIRALFDEMKARGTIYEPTILVMAVGMERPASADWSGGDSIVSWAVAVTRAAHRAGVTVVAGTDAVGRETPWIHSELQILVHQVGMTPLEAIRAATETGARALGAQDSLGTVAVGKLADLVVLRADPAADIRNTQAIAHVVRGGRLHRREDAEWETPPLADPPPR
jgi:imidazolonepropionase-like amidohydrolase